MNRFTLIPMALAAVLTVGCASTPEEDSAYADARERYQQLITDEQVQAKAPTALFEAEQALQRAEGAEDKAEREHHLYLADQHMAVARAVSERKQLEERMQSLARQRDELRLSVREKQLEQARSELAALEAKRTERGLLVRLDDVFFETGKAELAAGTNSTFDKLAGYLREHPDQQVLVEGHTDSRGPETYNERLSEQRADAVKQAIVTRGVDSDRIRTRGYGESRPIASNATSGGRQLNRRVEIVFPGT